MSILSTMSFNEIIPDRNVSSGIGSSINANKVILLVMDPTDLAAQKSRGFNYTFSNKFAEDLRNKCMSDSDMNLSACDVTHSSAISPSSSGSIPLRMDDFKVFPTFIMIIDTKSTGQHMADSRFLYTGFFLTPDVFSLAGTPNLGAAMKITNRVSLSNNANGLRPGVVMNDVSTILDQNMDMFVAKPNNSSETLMNNLPGDIANMIGRSGRTVTYDLSLSNMSRPVPVAKGYFCPTVLVNDIANQCQKGMKSQFMEAMQHSHGNAALPFATGVMNEMPVIHHQNEMTELSIQQSLIHDTPSITHARDSYQGFNVGLDVSRTYTLQDITMKYGNNLSIKRVKRNYNFAQPVLDQQYDTLPNIINYLVSEIVPGIALGLGIAEISFEYDSNARQSTSHWIAGKTPSWNIRRCFPIHEVSSPHELQSKIIAFQNIAKTHLFDSIFGLTSSTDFVLWCTYNIGFGCTTQIALKDFDTNDNAVYESYDKTAPYTIPGVANVNLFTNNTTNMKRLIENITL